MSSSLFPGAHPFYPQKVPVTANVEGSTATLELDKEGQMLVSYYMERGSLQNIIGAFDDFVMGSGQDLEAFSLEVPGRTEKDGAVIRLENPRFFRPNRFEFDTNRSRDGVLISEKNVQIFSTAARAKPLTPYDARQEEKTYAAEMHCQIRYTPNDPDAEEVVQDFFMGNLPVMLGSILCHTYGMSVPQLQDMGECPNDPKAYFIIGGKEKVIFNQARLRKNRVFIFPHPKTGVLVAQMIADVAKGTARMLITQNKIDVYQVWVETQASENAINILYPFYMREALSGQSKSQKDILSYFRPFIPSRYWNRFVDQLESSFIDMEANPDPFPKIHGKPNDNFDPEELLNRFFENLFPAYMMDSRKIDSIYKEKTDELFTKIRRFAQNALANADNETWDASFAEVLLEIGESDILNFERLTLPGEQFSAIEILNGLIEELEEDGSTLSTEEQKVLDVLGKIQDIHDEYLQAQDDIHEMRLHMLAYMVSELILTQLGQRKIDNRDSWGNKELVTAGSKMRELFLLILKTVFRKAGTGLRAGSQYTPEQIFKKFDGGFISEPFERALRSGLWGVGNSFKSSENVVTSPSRINTVSMIGDVLMINKPARRNGPQLDKREVDPDALGYVCPQKTPEGGNCGFLEEIATLASASRGRPESLVRQIIESSSFFSKGQTNETWNPVFLNGRIIGWSDTIQMYLRIREARRSRLIPHDICPFLAADRLEIHTDPGRLIRPLLIVDPEEQRTLIEIHNAFDLSPAELMQRGYIDHVEVRENLQAPHSSGKTEAALIYLAEDQNTILDSHAFKANLEKNIRGTEAELEEIEDELEADPTNEELLKTKASIEKRLQSFKNSLESVAAVRPYTHMEMDPSGILGRVAILAPDTQHNAPARASFNCKMQGQKVGYASTTFSERPDTTSQTLMFPQMPISRTHGELLVPTGTDPAGSTTMVAVMSYDGTNEEDGKLVSQTWADTGGGMSIKDFTETEVLKGSKEFQEKFGVDFGMIPEDEISKYHAIEPGTGAPRIGANLRPGDCVIAKTMIEVSTGKKTNISVKIPPGKMGYVTRVDLRTQGSFEKSSKMGTVTMIRVHVRDFRKLVIGNKLLSFRSGQKGTAAAIMNDDLLPFDPNTGERPAVIVNPHSMKKRGTIEAEIEIFKSAVVYDGNVINSSPFRKFDRNKIGQWYKAYGMRDDGSRRMISGIDGRPIQMRVYMGVSQVSALKHMVKDKIQMRSRGTYDIKTGQPKKGKAAGGGQKLGGMEIAALFSYGATGVIQERTMFCSDAFEAVFCGRCNRMAIASPQKNTFRCKSCKDNTSDFGIAQIPYTLRYLQGLLSGLWIRVSLDFKKKVEQLPSAEKVEVVDPQTRTFIPLEDRKTGSTMSRFERARLLTQRVAQLNAQATPQVPVGNMTDAISIARAELAARKIPLLVRRVLPDGTWEDWSLDEFDTL